MFGSNHNVPMASEMSVISTDDIISPPQSPTASLDSVSSLSSDAVQSLDGNSMLIPHNYLLFVFLGSSADRQVMISSKESTVNSPPQNDIISEPEWTGFKIVGDNIKTVKPRHIHLDRQASRLHYFNSYVVKDRVSFANQIDSVPDLPNAPDLVT